MHISDTVSVGILVDTSEFDEYMRAIADPERVKKIERKALRQGAMVIRDAVAERAPERPDLPSRTALPIGALKNDIVVRNYTGDDGREYASVQPGELTDHVASWVEYGHCIVVGPSGRSQKGYRRREDPETLKVSGRGELAGNVPAHPFFRPAAEASEDAAVQAVKDSLAGDLVNARGVVGSVEEVA